MKLYVNILGNPLCRAFSVQFEDWEIILDILRDVLGISNLEEILSTWVPLTTNFLDLLGYLISRAVPNFPGELYEFKIQKEEDLYGRVEKKLVLSIKSIFDVHPEFSYLDLETQEAIKSVDSSRRLGSDYKRLKELSDAYKQRYSRGRLV